MMKSTFILFCLLVTIHARVFAQDFVWAKGLSGPDYGASWSMEVDRYGNIYVTGYFSQTCDFDPGPGVTNLTAVGEGDIFLAKYTPNGDLIWALNVGSLQVDNGQDVTVDAAGNVFLTGYIGGRADFDPRIGTYFPDTSGLTDVFLAKYDAGGNFLWVKTIGNWNYDVGRRVVLDNHGQIYLAGTFRGSVDFDPGPGIATLNSGSNRSFFFAKYDALGNYIWAKNVGQTSDIGYYNLVLDHHGGLYISADFTSSSDFDPGPGSAYLASNGASDIFFAKYDTNGVYQWAKGVGRDLKHDYSTDIAVDSVGNLYMTGNVDGLVDFDPGIGVEYLSSFGGFDVFLAKYDTYGNFLWAKSMGGDDQDFSMALEMDAAGDLYITGYFYLTADFDPDVPEYNLTSAGLADIFIAKYNDQGALIWAKREGGPSSDVAMRADLERGNHLYISGVYQGACVFNASAGPISLTNFGFDDIFLAKYGAIPTSNPDAIQASTTIEMYPNPTRGKLYLSSPATASISTLTGQHLFTRVQASELDLSGLPSGMYLLTLQDKHRTVVKKVILEK